MSHRLKSQSYLTNLAYWMFLWHMEHFSALSKVVPKYLNQHVDHVTITKCSHGQLLTENQPQIRLKNVPGVTKTSKIPNLSNITLAMTFKQWLIPRGFI